MANPHNPFLRRNIAHDADLGAAPGGSPAAANPVAAIVGASTAPRVMRPGQAAPDVNPLPLGTRAGAALRRGYQGAVNFGVDRTNDLVQAGTAVANLATSGPRAVSGFVRDTARALAGAPASPNAGEPIAPLSAPTLERPYQPAAVTFQTDVQRPARKKPAAPVSDPNYDPAADNISARNLAVAKGQAVADGKAPTATPIGPQAAPALQRPTAAGDGLPGEVIDGVRVLSDGSHGIARTVSDQEIKDAAARVNTAPTPVAPLASDVLGYTPSSSDMANQRTTQLTRPITGSRPSDADFAASERNAIASGDWRSAAGTAASNLRQDAAYARTPRLRRIAEGQLASLASGAQQSAALAQQGEQQQAVVDAQGQNALDVADLQGQYGVAEQQVQLQRPRAGNPVTLADGTLALQDTTTGAVTPSTGPDGKPARSLVTRDDSATKRTQEIQDQLAHNAAELAKQWMPPAGADANVQPPYGQFREQAARLAGLAVVKNKAGEQLVNINGQWMPL